MKVKQFQIIFAVCTFLIVATVACNSTPQHALSHDEAILLAQQAYDQMVNQIPCNEGRSHIRNVNSQLGFQWKVELKDYPCATSANGMTAICYENPETEYIVVSYGDMWYWRVYCNTEQVVPVGLTYSSLQNLITTGTSVCEE